RRDLIDGEIDKWVIYGYDKGGSDLKVLGTGDGGLDELQEEFNDGKIQYAYVKVKDPNSELPKFIFIGWCGEGVPEARKGLFNSHLNEVSDFLERKYHLQISARSESDVEPSYIMKRLEKSGGSKYSVNINKNAPPVKPEPILPVRSVYKPEKIPNITEMQRNAPKEKIGPVRSSYQPTQIPDISELQRNAPLEKIEPVVSFLNAKEKTEPPVTENKHRREREERERAEREERQREERDKARREEQERIRREREEQERERSEREEQEREEQEHEEQEREEQEREEQEREEQEREQLEQERLERERRKREADQARKAKEEQQRLEKEEKERLRQQKEEEELSRQEQERLRLEELLRQQELESAEFAGDADATRTFSARVIYPYEAAEDNEMELIDGEIIVGISQLDEGWWQGESKDGTRAGLFPANYVEIIENEIEPDPGPTTYEQDDEPEPEPEPEPQYETKLTAGKSAKALYNYDAGEANEISFNEDDIITDIQFSSDDWWQGTTADGIVGLFPANYVELIN
ncbi:7220_t:CDS:10, partial [Scutellospora calospora]